MIKLYSHLPSFYRVLCGSWCRTFWFVLLCFIFLFKFLYSDWPSALTFWFFWFILPWSGPISNPCWCPHSDHSLDIHLWGFFSNWSKACKPYFTSCCDCRLVLCCALLICTELAWRWALVLANRLIVSGFL